MPVTAHRADAAPGRLRRLLVAGALLWLAGTVLSAPWSHIWLAGGWVGLYYACVVLPLVALFAVYRPPAARLHRALACGAGLGQVAGMVALPLHMLLLPNGASRMRDSLEAAGPVTALALHALAALLLGTWLLGAALAACARAGPGPSVER